MNKLTNDVEISKKDYPVLFFSHLNKEKNII